MRGHDMRWFLTVLGLMLLGALAAPWIAGAGNPYSEWGDFMIWPGGNPATARPDADQGVAWVANSKFSSARSSTDVQPGSV